MMTSQQCFKAVVFDAYGTIFDVDSIIPMCETSFPGQGQTLSQAWRTKQLEYSWMRSLMGRYEDFWRVTEDALVFACRALDLPCEPSQRAQLMEAYLRLDPFPEVRQALQALSGYALGVLSNGSPAMLVGLVENTGLKDIFAHVISADEAKTYKPDPSVYRLACDQTGAESGAIVFVSANPFDVQGAKSFGFWTCWVNRSRRAWIDIGLEPDSTVTTLTDLAGVLERLRT